ncbi:glutathione S-transferase family protein [Pseudomaricurvus alkylphenolicus]|uniref:glutathione S-transferase family protein n=1 Tax=Pseudomaricurvus alkylphenolicus TaxID=1306991 RepID=UPI0014227DE6|nr:glutathione S-transferase family protein [Pseudomaricurvus alkylphenolicus]NIB40965.1 glutathione S-transferase family protein [Pseudomaricurvus alkylphenolicus]
MLFGLFCLAVGLSICWFLWEKRHRKTHAMAGGVHKDITLRHEQEFELYHNALSLCSKKVRVCLDELGIPYKGHHIHLIETGYYETLSRHFLKVNPAGILPVLVHNGHPVYESHDILTYAASHSDTPYLLVPKFEKAQQEMQYWVDKASVIGENADEGIKISAGYCSGMLSLPLFAAGMTFIPLRYPLVGLLFHRLKIRAVLFTLLKLTGLGGFAKLNPLLKKMAAGRDYMHKHLSDLEQQLEINGAWIMGEQFTLADVSWLTVFERLREADWLDYYLRDNQYPNISRYWEALKSRDSYRTAILEHGHHSIDSSLQLIQQSKAADPALARKLETCFAGHAFSR